MKIQDIVFIIVLLFLLYKHNSILFTIVGLGCLILSIPLFSLWIFFTADKLVWYAAMLIFIAIVINIYHMRKED